MMVKHLRPYLQVHRLHVPLRHFSPQLFRDVSAFLEALSAAASHALPQVRNQ
jgi:hypothetical protein